MFISHRGIGRALTCIFIVSYLMYFVAILYINIIIIHMHVIHTSPKSNKMCKVILARSFITRPSKYIFPVGACRASLHKRLRRKRCLLTITQFPSVNSDNAGKHTL